MSTRAHSGANPSRPQRFHPSARKWWLAALFLTGVVLSLGCNPASIGYMLMPFQGNRPPEFEGLTEAKKNPKLVILVAHANSDNATPQLWNADRQLATFLYAALTKQYKENRESVTIVPPYKVDAFRAKNPDWGTMNRQEIGKHFEADFVIDLEINKLSLFEGTHSRELYRGRTDIVLRATDVKKGEEEGAAWHKHYHLEYPTQGPTKSRSDMSPEAFRAQFLARVARDLSRCFASYPSEKRFDLE